MKKKEKWHGTSSSNYKCIRFQICRIGSVSAAWTRLWWARGREVKSYNAVVKDDACREKNKWKDLNLAHVTPESTMIPGSAQDWMDRQTDRHYTTLTWADQGPRRLTAAQKAAIIVFADTFFLFLSHSVTSIITFDLTDDYQWEVV